MYRGSGRQRRSGDRGVEPEAPDEWQLDPQIVWIDAERQAEHVQLETFLDTGQHAEGAPEARLHACTAGRSGEQAGAQIILADRVRRQVGSQLRDPAQHERGERVRVRSGPDAVAVLVWILGNRALDLRNQHVDPGAADIGQQLRTASEPATVGRTLADAYSAAPAPYVEAGHFVNGERGGVCGLRRDPGMHAKVPAPAHRARGVDLHDRLATDGRIGSEP